MKVLAVPQQPVVTNILALKELVGQEIAVSEYLQVNQGQVNQFAEVTLDKQWIHVDVQRAAENSPFKGTILHGFLALSLFPHFVHSCIQIQGVAISISCELKYARFVAAIPVGSLLRARIKLSGTKDIKDGVEATWFITVERKGGMLPCCIAEWVVAYRAES